MCDTKLGLLTSAGTPVPLKQIDVSVTINGFVSNIQSTLLYVNTEDTPIEAIFTFPLDDQSAVYKFEADIDGRHLTAECHEKEKAKEIYDDAMSHGQTAMLLEEDESAGDIFRCKLGNLPSKAEAKISVGFATELDLEPDGKVRFTLPTVLNPRYTPDLGGLTAAGNATYATPDRIPYNLCFQLIIRGPQKVKGVLGPNDKLKVDYSESQNEAKVTLDEDFKFDHDLSVLVEYEDRNVPQILLEKGNPQSGGLLKEDALMVNFFLEKPAQIPMTNPGEFIFIIDRSGSMRGEKMQSAKETLLLFLKSLPVNCYFNVIGFGSNFESLFPEGSKTYNEENLRKAEELQKQMEADMGGTEILQPLEHVFKQKLIDNFPRQLFVLTDGEVRNTKDILKLARGNSQDSRVFTVGIGQGASTALVRGLAKAGRGKEVFVTDSERLQPKVISLLQCAMQPVASEIEVTWDFPSSVKWVMMPCKIPYFFLGVRQIMYLVLSGTDCVVPSYVCSMTLKGKLALEPFEYKETFTFHGNTETGPACPIHRLAAKAQIKELQSNDAPNEQIVTISKSANVISKHTAFVIVDSEGKVVEGISVERVVPTATMYSMPMPMMRRNVLYTKSALGMGMSRGSTLCSPILNTAQSCGSRSPDPGFHCLGMGMDRGITLHSLRFSPDDIRNSSSPYDKVYTKNSARSRLYIPISEDKSDSERMLDIIRLQTFLGAWNLGKDLLGLLKIKEEILKQTIPSQNDSIVATIAVIAWLRKYHMERRDEWQMLEMKALDWLKGQDLLGHTVEELILIFTPLLVWDPKIEVMHTRF